jgi:hypothetical protein
MEIAAHGFDTLRPIWEFSEGLPATDFNWQADMLAAGFESSVKRSVDSKTREVVSSEFWTWQDPTNSTLRLQIRGGRYLAAEFSAPRLLEDSPINLRLATAGEAVELLEYVGNLASVLVPGSTAPVLQKLSRADYACDLYAENAAPGIIAAGGQFQLPGTRKQNKQIHPHEGAIIRTPQQTMRTYSKGLELTHKLNPKQREQYAPVIQLALQKGLTRMEHMNRPRKAMSLDYLHEGPQMFAEKLEQGFPGGCVYIGGLHKLRAQIDALDVSAQRRSSLIAFATRYATLGYEGMQAAYSKPTFYRQRKQFLMHGLCLDEVTHFCGEVDFNPVIEYLRAA